MHTLPTCASTTGTLSHHRHIRTATALTLSGVQRSCTTGRTGAQVDADQARYKETTARA